MQRCPAVFTVSSLAFATVPSFAGPHQYERAFGIADTLNLSNTGKLLSNAPVW
jgi:hypothetical protein